MSLIRDVARFPFRSGLLLAAGLAIPCIAVGQVASTRNQQDRNAKSPKIIDQMLPLVFEETADQLSGGSAFLGRTRNYTVEVRANELRFDMAGKKAERTIRIAFENTGGGQPAGMSEAPFRTNRYVGNDPKLWRTGIRNFDRVGLKTLYPGIDAEFYAHGGEIEHDFMVAPGADAGLLKMHLSGAATMTVSAGGDVVVGSEDGSLRLRKPDAYQVEADGSRRVVDAAFSMATRGDEAELGFKLGAYDHARALVIDPVISYATYVTGNLGSTPAAITSDAQGNIYLTGFSGSTKASFYPASAGGTADPAAPVVTTFIAKLAAPASSSQIAWITYYGSPSASTQATSIALQPSGSTLYVGGTVADGALPTGSTATFNQTPVAGALRYGFVGTFATGTGLFASGTYIEGGQTLAGGTSAVTGLAVNAAGAVTISGYTTGNLFPTSTSPAPLIPSNDPSVQTPTVVKGLLLTLDQPLATELYGTYVCGDTCLTQSTYLTGVAADPLGNLYVSGYTAGDFPMAGQYVAANLAATPPVAASTPPMNMPLAGKAGSNAFAAQIIPTTQTVGYSFWSGGTGNDVANGVSLNPNESDLYVFGSTSSVDLVTNASTTATMTKDAAVSTPIDAIYPAAATTSGFLAHVDSTGQLVTTTYLGGTYSGAIPAATASSVSFATVDGSGNVYVVGSTNAAKAAFPQQTSGATTAAVTGEPLLPALEDVSADSLNSAPTNRGYLVLMPGSLSTVSYLANLGPSLGSSTAVGVAVDAAGTPGANAYVLLQAVPGPGATTFTTASAAQQVPQVADGVTPSAYVAQIAFAPPQAAPAIAAGANMATPNPVYYQNTATPLTVTLTWNITGASAAGANGLVFNLPYSANLLPYTVAPTVSVGGTPVANSCTLGVSTIANTNPGITCVVPGTLALGATAQFVLSATLSTAATLTSPYTFNVPAVAFDDQGDQLVLTQLVSTSQFAALALTASVSSTSANAALSATDTATPNTAVTYTYVITNGTPIDSPTTSLLPNLPAAFQGTATTIPAGCDPTVTSCDVPAHGSLTYKVTGVFLGSLLSSTAPGPFPEAVTGTPLINFGPGAPYSPVYASPAPAVVSVQGNAQLSASIVAAPGTFTYPAGAATGFALGDTGRTLVATVTNSGPNQAGPGSATVTLPQSFTPTAFTGCTVSGSSLACSYTSLPGNGNASFNITGTLKDTGTSTDAVPPPATSPNPSAATVAASPTMGTITAQVSRVFPAAGTYAPATAYGDAFSARVTRVNTLTMSAATVPVNGNPVTTYNETNVPHQNDLVTYVVTLSNSGTSVARGIYFTIPIATVTGGSVPSTVTLGSPVAASSAGTTSPANQLTCSTTTSTITCYENDLKAPAAAATTTPAAETYTVTFTASYNETTIPAAQANGQLPITQGSGTFYAAAVSPALTGVNYEAAPGTTGTATTITLQRLTHLVQTLAVSRVGNAPSTYADLNDINLDEHTGTSAAGSLNKPGINDTITITASTSNTGPNDAVAVSPATPMVSIAVPRFLLVVSVPAYCSFGGVSGGTTGTTIMAGIPSGASGSTMTCTPPLATLAVPAGTVSQIGSNLNAAGVSVPSTTTVSPAAAYPYTVPTTTYDGKNFVVTFNAKYVDANPSSGTVPGTHATGVEAFSAAMANGADADTGTDLTSSIPVPMTVQRAAHVSLTAFPVPVYTNGTALPKDTVLVPGGQAEIAQAAPGMNAMTRNAAAGKVYDCIRYVLTVANTGPNFGDANLNYAIDQGPFVSTQKVVGVPTSNPLPADCVGYNPSLAGPARGAPQTQGVGELPYLTGTQTVNLDGYFDLGTLGTANALAATFKTSQFTPNDYNDSNVPATGTATAGDYAGKQSVTVVNTPFNSPTSDPLTPGFGVTPAGGSPQVSLIFSTVTNPGITTYSISNTAPMAGLFPMGKSPNPPDLGATKQLYQTGKTPTYYNVPTTATVPSVATNPTSMCVSQAGGLPDLFVKPERSLLWIIQNAPALTMYKPVPNVSSPGSLSGDITTAVAPAASAASYTSTPAISFPQPPQAQPAIVCGTINGFPTSTSVAGNSPVASAPTIVVYEPVNFPPYVVAGTGGAAGGTMSKGSTVAQTQAYLLKSSTQTHDFNDSDPCYVAGARAICDDNRYLYAFVFGGGNTGSSSEFSGPLLVSSLTADPALAVNAFDLGASFNLSGNAQVYIAVADQATGADANNDTIAAPNYITNPFTAQGGFLTGKSAAGFPVCDPGQASGTYGLTPSASVTRFCTSVAAPTVASPTERYVPAGSPYLIGNVATAAVIGSASAGSGLIPLPYPADFTTSPPTNPPSASAPVPAIAFVTPGQTAGFSWGWLNGVVAKPVAPAASSAYALACIAVTSLTNNTPVSLPAGMTCTISTPDPNAASPTTFSYSFTNYIPSILVVTTGNSYARNNPPLRNWQSGLGEALAALLFPVLFYRRRLGKGAVRLLVIVLTAASLPLLSGCGTGGNIATSANVTPSGTYYLVVTATPTNTSLPTIMSAVFEVVVQKPN